MLDHLNGLADVVRSKNSLNDDQRGLLFDVLGVPLPLRDGTRRVPAANNGPALIALIEQEIARHEANSSNTLNQRDQDDQEEAMRSPSTYNDKTRKQLRSDHARALKRLVWAEDVLDRLRHGVPASTIIDPRTRRPIDPEDHKPPAPNCRLPRRHLPPPPPPPSASEAAEEPAATSDDGLPPFPEGTSDEDKESMRIYAEPLRRMRQAVLARMKAEADAAAAQAEPPPSA